MATAVPLTIACEAHRFVSSGDVDTTPQKAIFRDLKAIMQNTLRLVPRCTVKEAQWRDALPRLAIDAWRMSRVHDLSCSFFVLRQVIVGLHFLERHHSFRRRLRPD